MDNVDPLRYERDNVHNVYDKIAKDFDRTRYKIWPSVKQFVDETLQDTLITNDDSVTVLEVGCGNGKNIQYIKDNYPHASVKGCDMCDKFIEIVRQKGIQCDKANVLELDNRYPTEKFNVVLSVAVIHHLSTEQRRQQSIQQMFSVLKPSGLMFIQVWAMDQPPESKRSFENTQDQLVGWGDQGKRYYHLFNKEELEQLVHDALSVPDNDKPGQKYNIVESKYDYGNWIVVLHKEGH